MFPSLNISSVINLFFTFSMILLVYFYLKKRLDSVENKVDIMFNLIQEHQKQIKMQEIMNKNICSEGFCNVSDFSLPMCKDKDCDEHVNDTNNDSDESENNDTNNESDSESNDESGDESGDESSDESDDETTENIDNENHDGDIKLDNTLSKEINVTETLDVVNIDDVDDKEEKPEKQEQQDDPIIDETVVEPTQQNVNNWTQNTEGDNITVLEDNNNNKIKISIVKNIDSNIDYSKLKVQELKKIASERNIVGYSSLKKKELIKLLE